MENTPMDIIGIMLGAVLMFIVPLFLVADRADDISQLSAQTTTAEFINEVIKEGAITSDNYQRFTSTLFSYGNTFDIDLEVKILDKTTSKLVTDANIQEIGNNSYYSLYTSQVEDKIGLSSTSEGNNKYGKLILKQGDQVSVTVRNSSKTLSQTLKNIYYNITGTDIHIIVAAASGTVAINGSTGTT
mgnify:CR=1 FL=1